MVKIAKYMDSKLVAFLSVEDRDETIKGMVDLVDAAGKLPDKQAFYQAIMNREKVVSTGIGMGVAIPHAKLSECDDFFIAVGILEKGVDWKALDHAPIRIIFMIGGPDDKQTEYLQLLSGLTLALKDEERRKKMLTLNSPDAIIALFEAF